MTNSINVPRYRVEKTGRGFWPYCVRAGDGTREVFVGHHKQCVLVAAELETAFEDGKFVSGNAPSPAGCEFHGADHQACETYSGSVPCSPSPDGMEGPEVVGTVYAMENGGSYASLLNGFGSNQFLVGETLCRLSDAQAAIAAERARVVELEKALRLVQSYAQTAWDRGNQHGTSSNERSMREAVDAMNRARQEALDQNARFTDLLERAESQRDKLTQCLKFACTTMAVVADNASLRGVEHRSLIAEVKRIDAALSELPK